MIKAEEKCILGCDVVFTYISDGRAVSILIGEGNMFVR
jgi:hypothetical protein